jgi:16S rRNA processing protein RimM
VIAAVRPHQERLLVRFEGVDDRNAAEALRGRLLTADPLPDADDELFVHDLIGCEVRDPGGALLGRVKALDANPAHDLLVLDDNTLIPVVFIVASNEGVITVDPPEGLLDL